MQTFVTEENAGMLTLLSEFYTHNPGQLITLGWFVLHVLWLGLLLGSQVRGIVNNNTVYERMLNSHQGTEFPFDEGPMNNIKQFFGMEDYQVNWSNTYTLKDMYVV
jgi:hypothetical protein